MLETVDLEFERVLDQRETYRTTVEVSATDEVLNVDLLEKTLDALLPAANKVKVERYSKLLKELAAFDISRPKELEELINKQLDAALINEKKRVKKNKKT